MKEKDELFFEVKDILAPGGFSSHKLYVDAIYKATTSKDMSGDFLSKFFAVGNSGGFRIRGQAMSPTLIVLTTSGEDPYWRDELDTNRGLFTYYGDQKAPGSLYDTKHKGNLCLSKVFGWAAEAEDIKTRRKIPPIFVFKKSAGRDLKFLGLAVPGMKATQGPENDWLVAKWGTNEKGSRFQNYKAIFTILDTGSMKDNAEEGIPFSWIPDILAGKAYESPFAPKVWKKFIADGTYTPLESVINKEILSRAEQMPADPVGEAMLGILQAWFVDKENHYIGFGFETFSRDLVRELDPQIVDLTLTREVKDGGFDGYGLYQIFRQSINKILVPFYMEAKCYRPSEGLGVHQTSRLISRIKNREFGILVTTSYISPDPYKEIVEDRQPVVFVTGKNIIDYLRDKHSIYTAEALYAYLKSRYPRH
jgi:hypothetical protein